jgi:hypothetical protein
MSGPCGTPPASRLPTMNAGPAHQPLAAAPLPRLAAGTHRTAEPTEVDAARNDRQNLEPTGIHQFRLGMLESGSSETLCGSAVAASAELPVSYKVPS